MVAKPLIASDVTYPFRLQLDFSAVDLTEQQFLKLCSDNPDLRMELTAKRELIIMPPTGLSRVPTSWNWRCNWAFGPGRTGLAEHLAPRLVIPSRMVLCEPRTLPGCLCHGGNP